MAGQVPRVSESSVVRSLRRLKDRYFPDSGAVTAAVDTDQEDSQPGFLESLPVDLQFLVMTFLSPADLCLLGATCHYWRGMVRDPLLWRFFLLRDMPFWNSIDHLSMPQLELLAAPLIDVKESLDDREEGVDTESKFDYMAEYLRGSPSCRQQWLPSLAPYKVVTSFLQSLVASAEPRYAMFGPGMEQLDVSFVTRLMYAPDVLPVAGSGTSHRQIDGIGSGISYLFNNQHKLNILTMYSTNRAERERARTQQQNITNKLFTVVVNAESGVLTFGPAPHVQQVCQVVDGFIYVANAERDKGENEPAQIQALLSSAWGSTTRPLLVLSCISREDGEEETQPGVHPITKRVPCVHMAKRLGLSMLGNPWMVQDVVVESLSGLLDGISWLLRCSGVKLHSR
ncbi:F-box only protein 4 isoform X2 [Eucyclogobius newberryi]|uniref:F-box only protein 4 isoform X2 n=1 Tax=Eucyclogobius newberryi TaxID=166745 RepID=UPI003B5C2171